MSSVRAEAPRGRLQRIHVNASILRREVKEGGRTFEDINDYLRKYHGYRDFVLTEAYRNGTEIIVGIRRIGWWERLKNRFLGQ